MTVFSLETENGWRLEVTILSGMGVACSADSTVGGISEPSAMIKNKHDSGTRAQVREKARRGASESLQQNISNFL